MTTKIKIVGTVKCSKISNTFLLFSNKMLVNMAEIHKMLVRIAHTDQTDSSEEIDNEIISTAILLLSADSRRVIVSPNVGM